MLKYTYTQLNYVHLLYYSTVMPFCHIRSREPTKYELVIHCRTLGKNTDRKWTNKMAGLNNPNFDLFMSFGLEIIVEKNYYATRKISALIIC